MHGTIKAMLAWLVFLVTIQGALGQTNDLAYLTQIQSTQFLPATIQAGDVVSLAVEIKNRGSILPVTNLVAQLDLGPQFEGLETEKPLADIRPSSSKTVVFRFRVKEDTGPGYYPVFVNIQYQRSGDRVTEQPQSITVAVTGTEKRIDLSLKPWVVSPGSQTSIVFSMHNEGTTPVSNVSFSWLEPNHLVLPFGSDNRRFIPFIAPGGTEELEFVIAADPNMSTGVYPLDVAYSFTDSNGPRNESTQMGLIVGGTTDFEVSAEIGSSNALSISVANIGSNNAAAVVVRIPDQPRLRVSGSNVAILGNLNKGDYTLASFSLPSSLSATDRSAGTTTSAGEQAATPNPTGFPIRTNSLGGNRDVNRDAFRMPSSGPLTIEVEYTDTIGMRQKVTKMIELNSGTEVFSATSVRSSSVGEETYLWAIMPVLFLIAALVFNHLKTKLGWKAFAMQALPWAVWMGVALYPISPGIWKAGILAIGGLWFLVQALRKQSMVGP